MTILPLRNKTKNKLFWEECLRKNTRIHQETHRKCAKHRSFSGSSMREEPGLQPCSSARVGLNIKELLTQRKRQAEALWTPSGFMYTCRPSYRTVSQSTHDPSPVYRAAWSPCGLQKRNSHCTLCHLSHFPGPNPENWGTVEVYPAWGKYILAWISPSLKSHCHSAMLTRGFNVITWTRTPATTTTWYSMVQWTGCSFSMLGVQP